MRIFKFLGTALFTLFIFANLTSCGGENNGVSREEKSRLKGNLQNRKY